MFLRPVHLLAAVALAACRGGAPGGTQAGQDTLPRATRTPAVVYRLPSGGGPITVYELPSLRETPWGSGGRVSALTSAVGTDLQGRRLLYRSGDGSLTSFDLVAMRERTIAAPRFVPALAVDGTLLAVDSTGEVVESQPWGTRTWPERMGRGILAAFAAPGARLIALRRSGRDSLEIVSREGTRLFAAIAPEAADRAVTPAGDAVAFATSEGVSVLETLRDTVGWSVQLGAVSAVAFSPSGHRIYAALRERRELAVIDRFARERRGTISLPAPASSLRPDPWGRVLLARGDGPQGGSELWVIGLGTSSLLRRLETTWASDLPAVTESGVLLLREGTAVVARDARTLDSLGAVAQGAGDLWFSGRWVPASATAAARASQTERSPATSSSKAPARSADAAPRPPAAGEGGGFWIQLASSRNEQAIRVLARELQAQVVEPRDEGEPWRVVAGPFRSREAADSAGRALGRPYFLTERPRTGP
ncbi:MAG TPA: SPOR domain-containing protein [Gemmatimonadales bacterium]|nr:SPOR domain-containing protein [Gemmatimonadales bacterium]